MQPASCQDADNAALGAKSPTANAGTETGAGVLPGKCLPSLRIPIQSAEHGISNKKEKKRKKGKKKAQMEHAAQPLQKQSAPRKQMLLLQQARSCCRLSGSFSQAHEGESGPAAVTGAVLAAGTRCPPGQNLPVQLQFQSRRAAVALDQLFLHVPYS